MPIALLLRSVLPVRASDLSDCKLRLPNRPDRPLEEFGFCSVLNG